MFETILNNIQGTTPLVHCITNYVTVNDCANVLLACGGSPIMSDDEKEVEEITALCTALVINIGTLNERTVKSMLKAGKRANELTHPVILDPVGAGASKFRTETTLELLENVKFSVIRGNISEIKSVYAGTGTTKGVDADLADAVTDEKLEEVIGVAKELSARTRAIIAITGAIDIVADQSKAFVIKNGQKEMAKISGTGCMLSAMLGAFVGANKEQMLEATAAAVCAMGLAGEMGYERMLQNHAGTSSYRTYILDAISNMTEELLIGGAKIETR